MRRFYVPREMFDKNTIRLSADICKHIHRVLRLSKGDLIEVFDGECAFVAQIKEISSHGGAGILKRKIEGGNKKKFLRIRLLPAVIKSNRMDFLIEKAVELGVYEIQPILTYRGVVKAGKEKVRHWNNIARASASQSGRIYIPPVHLPIPFDEALEGAADIKVILHEKEQKIYLEDIIEANMHTMASMSSLPIVALLSGPEGGFTEKEVAQAIAKEHTPCGLGDAVLRAETAPFVALSILNYLTRKMIK